MANGQWFEFDLDGKGRTKGGPASLEHATQKYMAGTKVERSDSSPDGDKIKWTSWRFDNGVDLRYEGNRIMMWVPNNLDDDLCAACPHRGKPLPEPS